MYSPNIFSSDLYGLWSNEHQSALNLMSYQEQNHNTNPHNNNYHNNNNNNDNIEDINKQMRSLFAPPLSAYSAEYTGASFSQLENSVRAGSRSNLPSMSLTIHRKLERARKIRTYGYSTIRPIGINKTLEQLEYEEARRSNMSEFTDEHSFVPTAENGASVVHDSFNGVHSHIVNEDDEEDLDANIPNVDSNEEDFEDYDEFGEEDESGELDNNINEDDGFMAEDVEYQDDHSISTDTNMLINSSTLPNITPSNTNRSLNTFASIPSSVSIVGNNSSGLFTLHRSHNSTGNEEIHQNSGSDSDDSDENDENDENNENYSDMIIDEN